MRSRTLLILALVVAIVTVIAWGAMRVIQTAAAPAAAETPTTRVKRGPVTITVAARGESAGRQRRNADRAHGGQRYFDRHDSPPVG